MDNTASPLLSWERDPQGQLSVYQPELGVIPAFGMDFLGKRSAGCHLSTDRTQIFFKESSKKRL